MRVMQRNVALNWTMNMIITLLRDNEDQWRFAIWGFLLSSSKQTVTLKKHGERLDYIRHRFWNEISPT